MSIEQACEIPGQFLPVAEEDRAVPDATATRSRSLRILVAHHVRNDRQGGMSKLMGAIHDRVAADGHCVEYFGAEDVPSRVAGRTARHVFPWLVWRHAAKAAAQGRAYDVVNIHEPAAGVLALRRKAAGSPTLIVTSHGVEDRAWGVTCADAALGRIRLSWKTRLLCPPTVLWPSRLGFRRADHVFCLNEEDAAYIHQKYGVDRERITRVFPAADPAYAAVYPRRSYATANRLVFFGTWLARKGTPDLVAAFSRLASSRPDLKLTVMGAGAPADAVVQSFDVSLRDRVEYVPQSTAGQYAERMLDGSVFVIPSLFEGTPLTMMEAMATGLPVVASATCGMKDVIVDGINGCHVALRDPEGLATAIEKLLNDQALRERLGRRAHADVAANYTWDRVAEPIRAVYQRFSNAPRR